MERRKRDKDEGHSECHSEIFTEHLLCSGGLEETFCFRRETEARQGKWRT